MIFLPHHYEPSKIRHMIFLIPFSIVPFIELIGEYQILENDAFIGVATFIDKWEIGKKIILLSIFLNIFILWRKSRYVYSISLFILVIYKLVINTLLVITVLIFLAVLLAFYINSGLMEIISGEGVDLFIPIVGD